MPTRRAKDPSAAAAEPGREATPSPSEIFRAMNLTSRKLPHYFNRAFGAVDLRLTEFSVLQQLAESGPTSMVRLSGENLVTKAAVTAIIDVMETKGLVRRVRDASDRRIVNIELTPAGLKRFVVARRRHEEIVAGLVSTLEPDERRALLRSFKKLLRFMDQAPA